MDSAGCFPTFFMSIQPIRAGESGEAPMIGSAGEG
jgi:hypothetical protein